MNLTEKQKKTIIQVVNVFETSSIEGDYGRITIYPDGPNKMRQVTYGRSQTTEYGLLDDLLEMYVNSGGMFSAQLKPYLPKIGISPLADDKTFQQYLKDAGKKDPVMMQVQDEFFDKKYFKPAMDWMDTNGLKLPLSALIIYDSQVHSGGILPFLRKRFPAKVPVNGGDEKTWIIQYVDTRRNWLATHSDRLLTLTVYRMDCFLREINRNNWDLSILPVNANGINVNGV
jgi:chitosanase